jgi:predicted esterase
MNPTTLFLHGLDSSGRGTKGRYFTENFPGIIAPDFSGSLQERLQALETICMDMKQLVMIGSSFGGLMATCFAIAHPERVPKLILLAPALNFPEFSPPASPLHNPALLIIGDHDTVTPPNLVLPAARATFKNLEIRSCDDDHLLRTAFLAVDWRKLLA